MVAVLLVAVTVGIFHLQIEHKFSECVTDLQLAGGQFIESAGRAFCLTGYDSPELVFFAKN